MKSFRSYCIIVLLALATVLAVRAQLPSWAQDTIAMTPLEATLFRMMALPAGVVMHLRPPWESRAHLGKLIQQTPQNAELYSIRAREDERSQDYMAAEADWKQAADTSQAKLTSLSELADFYHRRIDPDKELNTLLRLAAVPERPDQRFQPETNQPQWAAFARAINVANEALLTAARHQQVYNAWIHRYPKHVLPYQSYLDWTIEQRNRRVAGAVAARLKAAFAHDVQLSVTTDANLARVESGAGAALAVYSKNFSPLWPEALRTEYFQALSSAHQLRTFLGDAQTAAAADPTSLDPALRLFFYFEQEGRKDIAGQQLLTLLSRRAARSVAWTAPELKTVAALLLRVADYDEATRVYYTIYQLGSAPTADKQLALSSLVSMLLDVPEQPLHFGNRDLSLYRNIAQMDRHPGFLNGILSLALNTTSPEFQYQNASQSAVAYFHRASASLLIDKLKQQFPNAPQTAELEAKLFSAYATYGQEDAIIRLVPSWLNRNLNGSDYISTALLLGDAYIWKQNTGAELALYDRLLAELAKKSGHMPIGQAGVVQDDAVPPQPSMASNRGGVVAVPTSSVAARSPDYSRVLDRYISRLVQLRRPMDAVALFRGEMDRNPDDPGIYQRFALFLEQNQLDSDVEQTYRDALNHFKDMSWASKLGRFYLRQQQYSAYQALARQITDTFKGSELARFLSDVGPSSPLLYRQVNLYAHQRFPYNLVFVNNLLHAYSVKPTWDYAAYDKLLRENWFNDPDLRNRFFEHLSSAGKLRGELATLPNVDRAVKDSNLAALEFRAHGQAWLTDYEAAAPVFVRLASLTPGDSDANDRAISIERSLAPSTKGAFDSAIRLAQQDAAAEPENRVAITRVGEIYADREMYAEARPWWNRVATALPGAPAGYLDSASVFWDYFQFNDSLRVIAESRQKLGNRALFAYEAGAIHENAGNYKQAVASYIEAALHGGSEPAKARLLKLARRKSTGLLVEQQTARLTGSTFDSVAFELRLALLEKQDRRKEIQGMLASLLPRLSRLSEIEEIGSVANRFGFDEIAAHCLQRTIAMSTDPIEKIQSRIELARFYETHSNTAAAEREFLSLLKDEPNRLGVVRAAVDFYWRQKQSQPAVSTLEAAADRAQPLYQNQLRREAAGKAADSGQYQEARRLLDQLLANDPYNGDLLAEKASTYARQNDNRGLVDFYAAGLKAMQGAPLPTQDKIARLAALRRGYILALAAVGQFTDALEQYQLVLNAYPEDDSLASEVARFAEAHQLQSRLTAYYGKATSDSPRDFRWPLVLARLETSLRQYPEAMAAYDKAAYVRPDRSDLFIAKANLETRLLRFDDALKSYQKLYELSFHDVQYLGIQAELYARLGNKPEALRLLRAAYIDPHPNESGGYVTAMRQMAAWHMFGEVDALFRELRPRLSPESPWKQESLTLETEALISLHRPFDAIALVAVMVQKPGDTAIFTASTGAAIQTYLMPQEKSALAQQISKPRGLPQQVSLLELAKAAGFLDLEAAELVRLPQDDSHNNVRWQALNQLQSARLLFEPLGQQLEAIAKIYSDTPDYPQILGAAFKANESAGDNASQLRLADSAGSEFARLFVLAGSDLKGRLARLGPHDPRANHVIEYLITNASADTAASAISARGHSLTPLWINSYTALTGLYSLSPAAWAGHSFDAVLGPRTVGGELTAPSPNDYLRGANWFYYAARYGEYLGYRKMPGEQDYLPATLEASPGASNSYVELADSYKDLKQPVRAAQLYRYALQLSPERADVYDRLALLALARGQHSEAITEWQHAFEILTARVEQGPLPPDYWVTASAVLAHVNRAHAMGELKPAADNMLRTYARRNGAYQFEPFLAGIFDHPPDRAAALAWVVELSRMPGMQEIVSDVLKSSNWIDPADKDSLYREQIERARKTADSAAGNAVAEAREELNRHIDLYARYLSEQKRWPEEWALLQQIQPASEVPPDLLLTASALTGHLDESIGKFRNDPSHAPGAEQVLAAASSLQKTGHQDFALALEDYEYGRELEGSSPSASAWFGMARVRFAQARKEDALSLIRNVTVGVGAPFENLPEAVRLLEEEGMKTQATQYALEWKTAEPWNDDAQLAFVRLKGDAKLLDSIRRAASAPYTIRVEAARSMRDLASPIDGSDELSLLTHKSISPAQASQPFYVQARLDAGRQSSDMAERRKLYQEAIALAPSLREPRLQLARAAFETDDNALGLEAFKSYRNQYGVPVPGQERMAGYRRVTSRVDEEPAPEDFLAVEQLAAEAYARRKQWALALGLYHDLLKREQDTAKRNALTEARDSIKRKQNLALANLSRRPVVTDDVAQHLIVKPKLMVLPPGWVANEQPASEEEQ